MTLPTTVSMAWPTFCGQRCTAFDGQDGKDPPSLLAERDEVVGRGERQRVEPVGLERVPETEQVCR